MVIYEFIQLVNFINIVKSNLKIYQKILKLFKYKNVSDFRKEKLLFNYSKSLLLISIKIIVFILSILGIIELSIIFMIYHLIRRKYYAKL